MSPLTLIIALLALIPINKSYKDYRLGRKIYNSPEEQEKRILYAMKMRHLLETNQNTKENFERIHDHTEDLETLANSLRVGQTRRASSLQETLGSTMQENEELRREREQLTRQLRSSDLTETENRTLRNELSTMQSVMEENDELAREMVAELEELRDALAEERAAAKEASAEYQDSVHQGDNVGQKIESQTVNDADTIARIALESYKQALKDMDKDD